MADGSIRIDLDLEVKKAEQKLEELKQKSSDMASEINKTDAKNIDKLVESYQQTINKTKEATAEAQKYSQEILRSTRDMAEYQSIGDMQGVQAMEERIARYQAQLDKTAQITEELGQHNTQADLHINKMDTLGAKTEKFDAKIKESTKNSHKLDGALKKSVVSVKKMTFALLGARTAYSLLNKITREWLNSSDAGAQRVKGSISQITTALTNILAPVLTWLANIVLTILGYINAVLKAFFGINLFAKSTATNIDGVGGGLKKANKELKKFTAGFDKAEVISENMSDNLGGGGGGADVATPSLDFDTSRFDQALQKLKDDLKPFLDMISEIDFNPMIEAFDKLKASGSNTLGILLNGFIRLMNEAIAPLTVIMMEDIVPQFLVLLAEMLNIINPLLERTLNDFVIPLITWFLTEVVPLAFELVLAELEMLATALGVAWKGALELWDDLKPFATFLSGVFKGVLEGITEAFKDLTKELENEDSAMYSAFKTIGKVVGALAVIKVSTLIYLGVVKLLTPVIALITKVFGFLWAIIKIVAGFFAGVFSGSILAIIALVALLSLAFVGLITNFEQIKEDFFHIIDNIKGFFKGLVDFIAGVFTGDWKRAFSGLASAVSNAFAGIVNIVKFPMNIIIDGVNAMVRGVNKMKIPKWVPGIGGRGFNLPQIPRLAKGGVLTRPTLNIAGEYAGARSNPEIVTPESLMRKIVNEELGKINVGSNSQPQIIQLVVDGKKLAEIVNDSNKRTTLSRNGGLAWNM